MFVVQNKIQIEHLLVFVILTIFAFVNRIIIVQNVLDIIIPLINVHFACRMDTVLQGESNDNKHFLCLCPHCHHGKMCEYSNALMSFTLDSLIVQDIQNHYQMSSSIYISIAILIFLFGLFNNLCSFLTFLRPKPRKFGVGNYLLISSIVDQCSLLLLLLKIIHIIFGSNGTLFFHQSLNLYSCKITSYLLSIFTRICYWLTSFRNDRTVTSSFISNIEQIEKSSSCFCLEYFCYFDHL